MEGTTVNKNQGPHLPPNPGTFDSSEETVTFDESSIGITEPPSLSRFILTIIAIIMLLGLVVWLAGYVQRGGDLPSAWRAPTPSPRTFRLVDSRNGTALILEQEGASSRILVKQSKQSGWLDIWSDDTSVANPVLSPDGKWIAYLSKRSGGEIVLTAVSSSAPRTISPKELESFQSTRIPGKLKVCDWTPVAWNAESDWIGFFACTSNPPFSAIIVADLSKSPSVLSLLNGSETDSAAERQLIWTQNRQIIATVPATGNQPTTSLTTLDVP